jgi:hypothetical protein
MWDNVAKPAEQLRWKPFLRNPALKDRSYAAGLAEIMELPLSEAKQKFEEITDHLGSRDMWYHFVEEFTKLKLTNSGRELAKYLQSDKSDKWFAGVMAPMLRVPELNLADLEPNLDVKVYTAGIWKQFNGSLSWSNTVEQWLKTKLDRILTNKVYQQWQPQLIQEAAKYKNVAAWLQPATLERLRQMRRLEQWTSKNIIFAMFPEYGGKIRRERDLLQVLYDEFYSRNPYNTKDHTKNYNIFYDAYMDNKPNKLGIQL